MSVSGESGESEDRSRLDGFELEIFKLVREGATSEQWKEWLRAPLEHAAADGNMDLFTRLMDAGADGSAGWRGCHGRTLLGAAAAGKSEEISVALLRAGAKDDIDVKFGNFQQRSALHVAAAHGAEAVSRTLMFAGADHNLLDEDNNTPLHLAAEEGHAGVVSDLLVRGADPNAKGRHQDTPLHLAATGGRVSCVPTLLLGGADKDSRNSRGQTPLCRAAVINELGVVEKLLAAKADPDIRADDNRRPLDSATMWNSVDVLRALLRHGADVKACDDNGYTALHHAADNFWEPELDTSDAVRVLLEAGADVEAKADHGYTALHVVTRRQFSPIDTIRALLAGGANVNARIADGRTPLHLACDRSNADGVELLLRWGADETLMDQQGDTSADDVGKWEQHELEDERWPQDRMADDQRIRHMLASAPADRLWRRRGWLVLARCRPDKVQLLAKDNRSSNSGSSAKVAKASCDGLGAGGGGTGAQAPGQACLVESVIGLDAEGVFRLIVGFL